VSEAKTALDLAERLPAQEEAALFGGGPEDVLVYQEAKRVLSAIPVDAAEQIAALRAELSAREAVIEEMTPIEALLTERKRAEKAERERDEARAIISARLCEKHATAEGLYAYVEGEPTTPAGGGCAVCIGARLERERDVYTREIVHMRDDMVRAKNRAEKVEARVKELERERDALAAEVAALREALADTRDVAEPIPRYGTGDEVIYDLARTALAVQAEAAPAARGEVARLTQERNEAEARILVLREALEWYADERNWRYPRVRGWVKPAVLRQEEATYAYRPAQVALAAPHCSIEEITQLRREWEQLLARVRGTSPAADASKEV